MEKNIKNRLSMISAISATALENSKEPLPFKLTPIITARKSGYDQTSVHQLSSMVINALVFNLNVIFLAFSG